MNPFAAALLLWLAVDPTPPAKDAQALGEVSTRTVPELRKAAESTHRDLTFALSSLFLSISDTTVPPSGARILLDSLWKESPTPLRLALLGMSEAVCARRSRSKPMEATRWVGRARDHLDKAVEGAPQDPVLRILRINSLVEVPEIFHVDEALEKDAAFLKAKAGKEIRAAESAYLLAIAKVAWRKGRTKEALACWKVVSSRKDDPASAEADENLARVAR